MASPSLKLRALTIDVSIKSDLAITEGGGAVAPRTRGHALSAAQGNQCRQGANCVATEGEAPANAIFRPK